MFQFEANGNLKKNYGVKLDQSKKSSFFNNSPLTSDMYIAHNTIIESVDKKSLYWLIKDVKSIREESNTSFVSLSTVMTKTTWTPLYQYEYGNINIANGELSEFKGFGDSEKKEFYLFQNTGSYQMAQYLYFFSETLNGNKILLSRMDLSK